MTAATWVQPNVTISEAVALGLCVAEWSLGGDEFVRAYGRTEDEAVANVLRLRDETAHLWVRTGPTRARELATAGS